MLWADWPYRLYLRIEPAWGRYVGEPIDHYILRFHRTMMPRIPLEIPLRRICDLVWRDLPNAIQQQIQYPGNFISVHDFLLAVLHAQQNVVAPLEDPPADMDEDDDDDDDDDDGDDDIEEEPELIIASDDESTDSDEKEEEEEEDPEEDPDRSDVSGVESD